MSELVAKRRRWESLVSAFKTIESEWGGLGQIILDTDNLHSVRVKLSDCNYGFPKDLLANDVTLDMWEVFMLLMLVSDACKEELRDAECQRVAETHKE